MYKYNHTNTNMNAINRAKDADNVSLHKNYTFAQPNENSLNPGKRQPAKNKIKGDSRLEQINKVSRAVESLYELEREKKNYDI